MAGSIKLFQFVRKLHQPIGIYPSQSNQKLRSTISARTAFLISYVQFLLTAAAFWLIEAKSMFEYGFIFFLIITIANCIAIYLIFIWKLENTLKFIENCEGFIEKRAESMIAYSKLIEKIELFNQFLCYGLIITVAMLLLPDLLYAFVKYYLFKMSKDSFHLFLPVWFPFDWKTPVGYLVAWLAQSAGCVVVGCIVDQFLNFVIGSCWLFILMAEDIAQDVVAFNFTVSNENRTELKKHFCATVQIYSNAKLCVLEFNQIFEYSLFSFFAWDMLGLSSLLVTIQFELWDDNPNFFEISLLILILIWMILYVFLLCEPGARMTNQFNEFNDELNRCDWYLLTIELQRWYAIFISNTQNSIKVSSFGNIMCERETSKTIINKAFSYFMTLRRFKL